MEELVRVAREALLLALLVAAPVLVVAFAIALVSGLAQAATGVSDPALGFVPKLVAGLVVLVVARAWMGGHLVRFARLVFEAFPRWTG